MTDPFPNRPGGRFDQPLGDALGPNASLGARLQANNPAHEHPRVQRWRASVQREISRNMAVEVAYNGSRGDLPRTKHPPGLPARTVVQQQQRPRRHAAEPAQRERDEPVLHRQLRTAEDVEPGAVQPDGAETPSSPARPSSGIGCCAPSPTCRAVMVSSPETLPVGANRAHSIEVSLNRRFANGFTAERLLYRARGSGKIGRSRNTIASRRSGSRRRKRGRTG